jgi:hypothetical protein
MSNRVTRALEAGHMFALPPGPDSMKVSERSAIARQSKDNSSACRKVKDTQNLTLSVDF